MSDYCASKFAAFGLLDTIRGELLKASVKNVNTLIVCPGFRFILKINFFLISIFKKINFGNYYFGKIKN